jgi:hypothetical protein
MVIVCDSEPQLRSGDIDAQPIVSLTVCIRAHTLAIEADTTDFLSQQGLIRMDRLWTSRFFAASIWTPCHVVASAAWDTSGPKSPNAGRTNPSVV